MKSDPIISGMPGSDCSLWPPNGELVTVGTIAAQDLLSGLAPLSVDIVSSEPQAVDTQFDVIGKGLQSQTVRLQAKRSGFSDGRSYTVLSTATDLAGNTVTAASTCGVPHDRRK
jgi:hypothetical protein